MLKNITPMVITQACGGRFPDGTPCGIENTFLFAYLLLGVSTPGYLEVGDQDGGLRIFGKKAGASLELLNSATMKSTASGVLTGDALVVTLADDGTDATSLFSEVKTAIESAAPTRFTVQRYGTDNVCPELPATELEYSTSPRGDKNQTRLPTCPNCGGVETLVRDFTALPAAYQATTAGRHKCAVNFLSDELKKASQTHPTFAAAYASESPAYTRSHLAGWPPGGNFLVDP